MNRRKIGAVCGIVLLIAAAVVVALRERLQPVPLPEVSVAQTPAVVHIKAAERKSELVERGMKRNEGSELIDTGTPSEARQN